jgi:hypothetical protein
MIIRHFAAGDEVSQVTVYNAAAKGLPGFKPASVDEVKRRTSAHGFDPSTRFYAEVDGVVSGYATFDPDTGRVSHPWTLPGHPNLAHPLFATVMREMSRRRIERAFAAYRSDWPAVLEYFDDHGFDTTREMINYAQPIGDLPTMFQRPGLNVTLIKGDDLPTLETVGHSHLRLAGRKLTDYFLKNPRFSTDAVFVLRRKEGSIRGFGVMIDDATYAPVENLDPKNPCFRFGAFGTEGLSTKRVNGLFSFLPVDTAETDIVGQDLLWYATSRMETNSFDSLAAQAPSDAPHLVQFYKRYFQEEGRFPILERAVGSASGF